ncbi:MAG: hypothetical protein R2774_01505 [Saprospiraceae bacterium]
MLTPYQFASNTPIQAIDLDGKEAKIIVHEIGSNSTMNYTVDLNDPKVNRNNILYADKEKYGTRGDLTVIKSLNSDIIIKKFEIGFVDRVKSLFDENSTELEQVDGGIMFTLSYGQGKEKRFSPNAEIGPSLDDLLDAFGVAKSTGTQLKTWVETFEYITNAKGLKETLDNAFDKSTSDTYISAKRCTVCGDTVEIDAEQSYHTSFDTILILKPVNDNE